MPVPQTPDDAFIEALPKAELHLHIEGSLTPERMLVLAERHGVALPYEDVDAVAAAYDFEDLQSFLDLYYLGAGVLRTAEDFHDLTMDYLAVCRAQNILHAEIMFDPQAHTERGVAFETVLEGISSALNEARRAWGQSALLIMSFLRHLPPASAMAVVDLAEAHGDEISAVGLDSSELGFPPEPFAEVFARCRALGWRCVAHAGEEGPPDYIRGALDSLAVERIDHGVRIVEDAELLERVREAQVPLTVCPLSNVKLRVFERLEDHNVLDLLRRGLQVTVNSDDPSYFGGYLSENFCGLRDALGLTGEEALRLARHSFESSFLGEAERRRFLEVLDGFAGA